MNISKPTMNTTPLIDVMLVLLVLLLLALPLSTHKVALDLPPGPARAAPPRVVNVDIDFDGRAFWNGVEEIDDQRLQRRLESLIRARADTQVNVWPDRRAPYERVAQVLASAQRANVTNLALSPIAE